MSFYEINKKLLVERLSHDEGRHTARVLDHLKSAAHVSLGVGQRLTLLLCDVLGQLLHVTLDQSLQLEEILLTRQRRSKFPFNNICGRWFHRMRKKIANEFSFNIMNNLNCVFFYFGVQYAKGNIL